MSRLLFLADTQIGVGTITLADQRTVLDRIVEVALDETVDAVVHGGDVFEGPVVLPEHLRMFLDATEPLRRWSIPLLVLRGNGRHDMAVRSVHALDVLRDIPGFLISDRPDTFSVGGIAVCTLPWVHPGRLIAHGNGSIDHDKVNAGVTKLLVDVAHGLKANLHDRPQMPSVLVAHWAISGAKLPSGLAVDEMREPVLPWAELDAIGYDLVVGAHVHEPQMLSNPEVDNGPGFVVGSPQQLNFGEHGEHGCWMVGFGGAERQVTWEFIPIESREFVTVDKIAPDFIPPGAIVRFRAGMSEDAFNAFDQAAVREAMIEQGASQVRFDIDVQREARRRAEIDEQLGADEAMGLYCDAAGVEQPLRSQVIQMIRDWSSE